MKTSAPPSNSESIHTRPSTFGFFKVIVALLLGLAAFIGLAYYVFSLDSVGSTNTVDRTQTSSDDTEGDTENATGAATGDDGEGSEAGAAETTGDGGDGTEAAAPTAEAPAEDQPTDDGESDGGSDGAEEATALSSDDIQSVTVGLDDPLALTEATASATFDMDPATGEICYGVSIDGMASPYDGHIHVGPAGVKGAIVVDLGSLSGDSPSGCLPNLPADTQAILEDLGGHYVEFHDPDGVRTVRAQLSDIEAATTSEDDDGAVIVIDADQIRFVGDVPDQETIDKLLESFADIDLGTTTLDTSGLSIVPGATRPSGRIVVDDAVLFDVDSDELSSNNLPVLDTLATILVARPAWNATVIGYTDNTGSSIYNLELSLRRAFAVRDALGDRGVPTDSLRIAGGGDTKPIADNDTEEGRSQNRRIEFEIEAG